MCGSEVGRGGSVLLKSESGKCGAFGADRLLLKSADGSQELLGLGYPKARVARGPRRLGCLPHIYPEQGSCCLGQAVDDFRTHTFQARALRGGSLPPAREPHVSQ